MTEEASLIGFLFAIGQMVEKKEAGETFAKQLGYDPADFSDTFFKAAGKMAEMGNEIAILRRDRAALRRKVEHLT
jgi:hypothetical protein